MVVCDHKIVAGICTLGQPEDDFIDCVVSLVQSSLLYKFCKMTGTLLPFCRNAVIEQVYVRDPDFTHLFFIDDDMHNFNDESLQKLIDADKDVISAFMLKRKPPYQVVHSFKGNTTEQIQEQYALAQPVKVDKMGMAFTLIKREVLDAIREETDRGPLWFTTDREPRQGFTHEVESFIQSTIEKIESTEKEINLKDILYRAIFMGQMSHIGTTITGEDVAFCCKANKLGFETWVHCGVPIGHIGKMSYDMRTANPELERVGIN